MKSYLLLLVISAVVVFGTASATITVASLNTRVLLNTNTSAQVTEVIQLSISNQSVSQYTADRLALNFTLANWQNLIGPSIVEHIINPKGAIVDLKFLPGPVNNSQNGKIADLLLSYLVTNVTAFNQTAPRTLLYQFNNNVFNFQHAESGQVLGENTTLTIVLPLDSKLVSVYPLPDYPILDFSQGFSNATQLSWSADEPLSKFSLDYTVQQSLGQEVIGFFDGLYRHYGVAIIIFVILVIALFIAYAYFRAAS